MNYGLNKKFFILQECEEESDCTKNNTMKPLCVKRCTKVERPDHPNCAGPKEQTTTGFCKGEIFLLYEIISSSDIKFEFS